MINYKKISLSVNSDLTPLKLIRKHASSFDANNIPATKAQLPPSKV